MEEQPEKIRRSVVVLYLRAEPRSRQFAENCAALYTFSESFNTCCYVHRFVRLEFVLLLLWINFDKLEWMLLPNHHRYLRLDDFDRRT